MSKRILVRTPRGIRSIETGAGSGGSSGTYTITYVIPKGTTLIQHNNEAIILEVFYEDAQGWWEALKASTYDLSDELNQVWVYSGKNLGTVELKLKS